MSDQTGKALANQPSMNQALQQAIQQRLKDEVSRTDPQAWKKMEAMIKAGQKEDAEEESEIPRQQPPQPKRPLVSPKGAK